MNIVCIMCSFDQVIKKTIRSSNLFSVYRGILHSIFRDFTYCTRLFAARSIVSGIVLV